MCSTQPQHFICHEPDSTDSTWSICPRHWSIVTSNNFAALHCWSSCAEESVIILEWNRRNQTSHLLRCDKNFNQETTKVQNRSLTDPTPTASFLLNQALSSSLYFNIKIYSFFFFSGRCKAVAELNSTYLYEQRQPACTLYWCLEYATFVTQN